MQISSKTLEKAIAYATKAHEGQTRKGDGRPYIMHPLAVCFTIMSVKRSSNPYLLACAAVLHDVVEDCWKERSDKDKLDEIAREFGYAIAALVEELTLDKSKYVSMGKKEYLKQELLKMSSYALAIKLADRLNNVSDLDAMKEEWRTRYIEETRYILDPLGMERKLTPTHKRLIKMIYQKLPPVVRRRRLSRDREL